MVTNLPGLQETWTRPLGWEDPLEREMATHSSILTWSIPWTEEPGRLQPGVAKSRTQLSLLHFKTVTVSGEDVGRLECEFRVSGQKLLWINNKVLLYSTGNYIQFPMINHNGNEYKKECMCMCN